MRKILLLISILAFFLRFYQLGINPPSLYWDEASLGYNSYAIANYGIDEHGERYPLARFIAFGDYKPPGYIYAAALAIKAFNLSEWSIRLPSAVAGVLMVLLTYRLTVFLFTRPKIALTAALFLATSPWSLQLSRVAFEAHLAAYFNLLGVVFFFLGLTKKRWFYTLSIISFLLAFYTFNANRVIAPLLFFTLCLLWFKRNLFDKPTLIVSVTIGMLLLFPSLSYFKSRESTLRFQEVSIFTSVDIVRLSNERIAREDSSIFGKLFHNRRLLFAQEFAAHFLDHFDPRYLFLTGDRNPRLSTQFVGSFYLFEIFLLIPGIYYLFFLNKRSWSTLIIWLVIAILPAATARETPHALRTASILPVGQIFSAAGVFFWLSRFSKKRNLAVVFSLVFTASIFYHLHMYYLHAPSRWSGEWQYGYKDMVTAVGAMEKNYKSVVVTRRLGRPYIYFLLYNRIDPSAYLALRRAYRDWWGFWEVKGFAKYYFDSGYKDDLDGPILYVGIPSEVTSDAKVLRKIYSPSGEEVFVISEL